MTKPFRYTELSDRVCKTLGCERRIKKNVLVKKPDADRCYKCYRRIRMGGGKTE